MKNFSLFKGLILLSAIFLSLIYYVSVNSLVNNEVLSRQPKAEITTVNKDNETTYSTKTGVKHETKQVNKADKQSYTFNQWLATLDEDIQQDYMAINNHLFNALEFQSKAAYQQLVEGGLPSVDDIRYLDSTEAGELSRLLFESLNDEVIKSELSENRVGISAANFSRILVELENHIRFYFPEYQSGKAIPKKFTWPSQDYPEQIKQYMRMLVLSSSATQGQSIFANLVKARFEQISQSFYSENVNQNSMFKYLAKADIQYSKDLSEYVKAHYPEQLNNYLEIKSAMMKNGSNTQ